MSSAFDTPNWNDIASIIDENLFKSDLNAIRALIVQKSLYLKKDSCKQSVKMKQGVPQGGTLSPLLYSYIIDKILSEIDFDDQKLTLYLYADDVFLRSNNPTYLEQILNKITRQLQQFNFKANPSKYQICASEPVDIFVNDQLLQQTDSLKYLGVHLNHTGIDNDYNGEIQHKKQKLGFVQHTLGTESIKNYFRVNLYESSVVKVKVNKIILHTYLLKKPLLVRFRTRALSKWPFLRNVTIS